MYELDFEYDGHLLSDYGFIVCEFNDSSSSESISAGSKITFNTVTVHRGNKHSLVSTQYDECIQTTFQICKNPCIFNDLKITDDEFREIMRWLNRKEFLKFSVKNDEAEPRYYDASFSISKIKIHDELYGLELAMETNRPFGYGKEELVIFNIDDINKFYTITDKSDEIGYLYPSLVITLNSSLDSYTNRDLVICNQTLNSTMVIKNCIEGEVITIDGDTQVISTTFSSHDICNDFNYEFFKIENSFNNRVNKITVSLPCKLEVRYHPIIKGTP